ncbi:MAG: hypothetical protein NZ805_07320 [Armatimonadetes bacterium]|nr:hypothetical protein [Armatimonadota bacterium]MDW8028330.1 hypothetical protein [Armatimonadota bacterium]
MGTGEIQFSQLLGQGSQFVQQQRPELAIPFIESIYHQSWQIALATSIICFLLSLIGVGLIIGAPLVMKGVKRKC